MKMVIEMKRRIQDIDVRNKRVLLRCDFNVPVKDGVILDDKDVNSEITDYAKSLNIPLLDYQGEDYKEAYSKFYDSLMD